jgi:hypothetical protein
MSADLGARLHRAGLITREVLAETLAIAPLHGSAFLRALLQRGVSEDALVGYFVAEGFGPLLSARELLAADEALVARIPARLLREFAVLPVRTAGERWVVAMITPSERHVVTELERIAGVGILPAVARWSELRTALADVGGSGEAEPEGPRPSSEPPWLALPARPFHAPLDSGYGSAPPAAATDVKVSLDPEDAVPLVRHKPIQRAGVTPIPEKIVARSFGPPRDSSRSRSLWARPGDDEPGASSVVAAPTPSERSTVEGVGSGPSSTDTAALARPEPTPDERWDVPPQSVSHQSVSHQSVSPQSVSHQSVSHQSVSHPSVGRPSAPPEAARLNKLAPRSTRDFVGVKAPIGDVRGVLAPMRQTLDRDDAVRLVLDGALSVCRSAVFFAYRRGLLKGWDAQGSGVSRDSARNLWIPTSTPSLFQRVVDGGAGYFGPYGNAIADGLFRAAVGSRGGDLALLPIKVSGKVVGLLACDDVRAGPQGQQRLELLATAVEEAFSRIIVVQKQG